MELPASERPVASPETYDVVIVGAGPAGSAAARLLSRMGHSVALVSKPDAHGRSMAESIPPSCRKLLDRIGVLGAVNAAGFYRTTGNTVWWGEGEARTEVFPAGSLGYQALRSEFDRVLLACARQSGVRVLRATVREIAMPELRREDPICEPGQAVRVEYAAAGMRGELSARWLLDCSGRSGLVARRLGLREEGRADTVALAGVWDRNDPWPIPDESHTLVETYGDGWAWSVPLSASRRYVTVMVDPGVTELIRGERVDAMYRGELAKTTHLQRILAGAAATGRVWGCDASLYTARQFSGDRFLLVGDAGSFIDPLSSFGVKKALASAWLAAVVVHTILESPDMESAALELFEQREREVYAAYADRSAQFFDEASAEYGHAFWSDRASVADFGDVAREWDVERLRADSNVLAAFESLRNSSAVELHVTPSVRRVRRPAVQGNAVVLEDQIVADGVGSGVRYLRDVDLPRLLDLVPDSPQVPELYDAYNRSVRPVSLPDFLGALSVLLARRVLRNRALDPASP